MWSTNDFFTAMKCRIATTPQCAAGNALVYGWSVKSGGDRGDGGGGVGIGLRAEATRGCGGSAGIFESISTSAASLLISLAILS
jgi:hypothetical protein